MICKKFSCKLVVTLKDDATKQSKQAMIGYIKEALRDYSGCYDPDDALFAAIESVQVREFEP